MNWWTIVKQGKILIWPNILKKKNIGNGTILLYDPRQNSAEQVMEKHYPFSNIMGISMYGFKAWVPIKVKGVSGRNDSPPVEDHIEAMEKKLGKQLPKEMKEKMLASKNVDDFMEEVAKHRIGFIYIAPVSSWRKDLSENWFDIATWQGNGYGNMITAAPIPKDYWHYDSAMNNKGGIAIWSGQEHNFHSNQTDSLMTKEMLRLNIEEIFEDEKHSPDAERLKSKLSTHNLGSSWDISVLMREVINRNLDSDWKSNQMWETYESNTEFKEWVDAHGGKELL